MILQLRDYARYPSAIIDLDTPNKSFLELASVYYQMGVKNWGLILVLHDPDLVGIDPHSPMLSEDIKVKIGIECAVNPWYVLREVIRVPPRAGRDPVPLRVNRGNVALWYSIFNSVDFALIQPRQTGKSISSDVLDVVLMVWILWNSRINLLTKDNTLRVANVDRIKELMALIPPFLFRKHKEDKDNQVMVTYKSRGNEYLTAVQQSSEAAALKVGRGLTSMLVKIDEGPFIRHIGTIVPALLTSGNAARKEARGNGLPSGVVITTTAGKKDDEDGKYMHEMIFGGCEWSEMFFDCEDPETFRKMVDDNSAGTKSIINGTFSHTQLGYDDAWMHNTLRENNLYGAAADRDMFNVWTSGTQLSPLSVELNERIKNSVIPGVWREIDEAGYIVTWFISEERVKEMLANDDKVVVSFDTSEAVGVDDIAMVLTHVKTLETLAVCTVNETNLIKYTYFVARMMVKYTNLVMNIERKSTGIVIIDGLLLLLPKHGIDPYKRIINTLVDKALTDKDINRHINTPLAHRQSDYYDRDKRYFGFMTTAASRLVLYTEILQTMARRGGRYVRSSKLSEQIRGLVAKNGRIDHVASGHDDLCIAWLIAGWTIIKAPNLHFYGINPLDCMSHLSEDGLIVDEEEAENLEELREERAIISDLVKQFVNADDEWNKHRLRRDVNAALFRIESLGAPPTTLNEIVETLKLDKDLDKVDKYNTTNKRNTYRSAPRHNYIG